MRLGEALGRLWLSISALVGLLATASAMLLAAILPLAMIVAASDGELFEKWPAFLWMVLLWLSVIAFLNMLYFFSRLKRANQGFHNAATGGVSASTFLMSSQSAYRVLHSWVSRVAKDRANPYASNLRFHANLTRYINLACLYGWLGLVLALVAIAIYAHFIRAT